MVVSADWDQGRLVLEPRLKTRVAHHVLEYAYNMHRSQHQRRLRASFYESWSDHERAGAYCVRISPIGGDYTITNAGRELVDLLRGKKITHDRAHSLRIRASTECLHQGLNLMAEKWAELALLLRLRKGPRRTSRNSRATAMSLLALIRAIQSQATETKLGGWIYPVFSSHGQGNRPTHAKNIDHPRCSEAFNLYQVMRTLHDNFSDVMTSTFHLHSNLNKFSRGDSWQGGDDRLRALEMYGIWARSFMGIGDWKSAAKWMHRQAETSEAFYGPLSQHYRHSISQLGQIYLCGGELSGAEACFRTSLRRVRANQIKDNRGVVRALPLHLMTRKETLVEGRSAALAHEREQRRKSRWGYNSEDDEDEEDEEKETSNVTSIHVVEGTEKSIVLPEIAGATTWEPALEPTERRDYEDPAYVGKDPDNLVPQTSTEESIEKDALYMGRTLLKLKQYDRAEELLESCVHYMDSKSNRGKKPTTSKLSTTIDALTDLKSMFQHLPKV